MKKINLIIPVLVILFSVEIFASSIGLPRPPSQITPEERESITRSQLAPPTDFGNDMGDFDANPNVVNYSEAHYFCEGANRLGAYGEIYNQCMYSFMPFRQNPIVATTECSATPLSWGGMCNGVIEAGQMFERKEVLHVRSGNNTYSGIADYQCMNGTWVYKSGVCIETPKNCEAGEIAQWPVTSPEWASTNGDPTSARFSPKPNCKVSLPASRTGIMVTRNMDGVNPDVANWPDFYDQPASVATLRCFNGKWTTVNDQYACVYEPQSCSAQNYTTEKGCTFELRETEHDNEYVAINPLPNKSIGEVRAFCWDGNWEIKSESCTLSCINQFSATNWASNPVSTQSCRHSNTIFSAPNERTAPNEILTLNNENTNLQGALTRKCEDGFWKADSEYCIPRTCNGVPSNTWIKNGNVCTHDAYDKTIPHGGSVNIKNSNSPQFIGSKFYSCNFGVVSQNNDNDVCNDATDTLCFAGKPNLQAPFYNIETWAAGCSATCRYLPSEGYTYCSSDCIPTTPNYCVEPVGEVNTTYSRLTSTTCPIQVASTPTTKVGSNIGRVLNVYRCNAGTWTFQENKCVVGFVEESSTPIPVAPTTPPVTTNIICSGGSRNVNWISSGGVNYTFNFTLPATETGNSEDNLVSRVAATADASCSTNYVSSGSANCVGTEWQFNLSQICEQGTTVPTTWSLKTACANENGQVNIAGDNICDRTALVNETTTYTNRSAIVVPLVDNRTSNNWGTTNCPSCSWSYTVVSQTPKCTIVKNSEDLVVGLNGTAVNGDFCNADIKITVTNGSTVTQEVTVRAVAERKAKSTWADNVVLVYDNDTNLINDMVGEIYYVDTVEPYVNGQKLSVVCPSCTVTLNFKNIADSNWTYMFTSPNESLSWEAIPTYITNKGHAFMLDSTPERASTPSRTGTNKDINFIMIISDGATTKEIEGKLKTESEWVCQNEDWTSC